ncbi:MAG TPA: permease prefix domain 1-containing protein [Actinomycetota bacterium]|nr:permease prefix domain 1-containing protein [Actinomycetota bacterium]
MDGVESQIAEWRAYVAKGPAVGGRDVDELEAHLRDQIAELDAAGLTADEAFLVAVKRMGDLDTLSREFAREHRGRLWKQLVLRGEDEPERPSSGWVEALLFATAAAVAIQVARLAAGFPEEGAVWFLRNIGLFPLPFVAGYFARRRQLDPRRWVLTAAPFVLVALVVNLYPYREGSATELLVALHLPVVLWFAVAYPYMGGTIGSHERRMDFVRFTGEWVIYYVLIALGGGVLLLLTALILEPIGPDVADRVIEWVLPSGAAGAVIVAGWLVESKQQVVENMAPVLTMLFTPLFAVMLTVAAATYAVSGVAGAFDRELLGVFDALLVVVLGLVLYAMSAREPARPAGLMDRVQLLAVASALVLDVMVLGAMVARIGDLGFTPNRVAALGLNLVLLVNLAGTAWLSTRFLMGRIAFHRLERWQISYLPVFALWAATVVAILPPLFAFT